MPPHTRLDTQELRTGLFHPVKIEHNMVARTQIQIVYTCMYIVQRYIILYMHGNDAERSRYTCIITSIKSYI